MHRPFHDDDDIHGIAMTLNIILRECPQFRSPVETYLAEFGSDIEIRLNGCVALRG